MNLKHNTTILHAWFRKKAFGYLIKPFVRDKDAI